MNENNEERWQRPKESEKEAKTANEKKVYSKEEWTDIFNREKEENRVKKEHKWKEKIDKDIKEKKETVENAETDRDLKIIGAVTKNIVVVMIIWFVISTMTSNYYHNKEVENFKKEMEITGKALDDVFSDSFKKINRTMYQGSNFKEQQKSFLNTNNRKPAKKWKRTFWEAKKSHGCVNNVCTYKVMQYWRDCSLSTKKCNTQSKEVTRSNSYIAKAKVTYL